jgi:antitoxin PrlF
LALSGLSSSPHSLDRRKENPYIWIAQWQLISPMITSKITSKAQTTIPQPVRSALRVGEGDELAYRIEGDHVILTKAKREPIDDPFATFHEWSSEADRRAYGDL